MASIDSLDQQQLVGRVLQWLEPKDLCNARQAARLFDRTSRLETDSFSVLKLRPDSILSWRDAPDFSRFPLLACLHLKDALSQRARDQLRKCFAVAERPSPRREAACAVLAALGKLDCHGWGFGGPVDLTSVLRHMPGITSLRLTFYRTSTNEALTGLATLPAMVPRIERLDVCPWSVVDEHCARMIGSLPCLRSLMISPFDQAHHLATLSCSRLTLLGFAGSESQCWPPLGCDLGLPWPNLRELRDIDLPAGGWAERLALGLPHLTLLVAQPSGDWGIHAPAAFPNVGRAVFFSCPRGFRRLRLRSLVPAVEFLEVVFGDPSLVEGPATLSGLTRLSHLAYSSSFRAPPLPLCEWEALAAAPRLAELKSDAAVKNLGRLASLTGLESLHLRLDLVLHHAFNAGRIDHDEESINLGDVGSALSCMPKLKRLVLVVPGGRTDNASLVKFADGLRGVTCLQLVGVKWTAEQLLMFVSRVKAPLRTLWLPSMPLADAPDFAGLLNEQAERGLVITGMGEGDWRYHPANDFSMFWQYS